VTTLSKLREMRVALLAIRIAALTAAISLPACGGETPAPEPELRARVGAELAARADAVAASFDSSDACAASERAEALQRDVTAAIDSGRVPPALQRELERTSARLVEQIDCIEEGPPPDGGEGGEDEEAGQEGDEEGDAASCEALEARKAEIDAEKEELEEQIEDEKERKDREKELEKEKRAIEKELKACEEGE